MKRLLSHSLPALAFAVFALTLTDVASGLERLPARGAIWLAVGGLVLLFFLARSASFRQHPIPFVLLGGSLLALGTRIGGFEAVGYRTPAEWMEFQSQRGETVAADVSERFASLCQRAALTARSVAGEPSIRRVANQPDDVESLAEVFQLLETLTIPAPLPESVPGVALYDQWFSPLAWGGNTVDLRSYFEEFPEPPARQTIVFEQGVFTHLLVMEPIEDGEGTLVLEIPLSARRGIDNRYLRDFEVAAAWSGNRVSTDYVDSREAAPELATLFERSEDRYWGGTEEAPVLYFPLRSPDGNLLAVVQLEVEDPATALLETRRTAQQLAGIFLSMAALFPIVWLGVGLRGGARGLRSAVAFLVGLWGFRLVVSLADVPLGFFLGLDNPANYASGALFALFRSPADFLLTSIIIALTAATLAWLLVSRNETRSAPEAPTGWLGAFLAHVVARIGAAALIVLAVWCVRDSWSNSNLDLATPGLFPLDPPRLAVQLALVGIWVSAALVAVSLVLLAEWVSGDSPARPSFLRLARYGALDLLVLSFAYSLSGGTETGTLLLLALPALIAFDTLAFARESLSSALRERPVYYRFAAIFLGLVIPVLSFFPAVGYFERWVAKAFVEQTVAPAVLHQDDSQLYVLQATLRAIDRMELAGQFSEPESDQIAYRIWSGSDLSDFALSSAVDIFTEDGALVSRFALNFPDSELEWHEPEGPPPEQWVIYEETYPGEPNRPRVFHARRALPVGEDALWDLQIRLVAGWSNLPFIATRSPYADLFRSAAAEAPLPAAHPDLALYVFDRQGQPIFGSGERMIALGGETLAGAGSSTSAPHWIRDTAGGERADILLFSDEDYIYGLAFPAKPRIAYGADVAGWVILAAFLALALLLLAGAIGWLGAGITIRARDLWADVGTSFYGKLFVAFVLLALIPIASLAFVVRGIMVQQLQRDVELEGVARAQVVGRFVRDYLLLDRIDASERGVAAVSDPLLEWVSSLVSADVDLFSRGELVATSERELFDSGLLPGRVPPTAYREVVLSHANHSIHRESVGAFQYFVVSVPISLERWREPGVLSLPLASRQREIDQQVQTLNQTVLLTALAFFLVAAILAYSLARRIAGPINTLTATTRSVAQGDFDVSLETTSRDEIGALFASFNQMTADLKRQREHLERTKKLEAWAEMARQVAHEVKNPLTPIQLSTEHLLRVYEDPNVDFRSVLKGCSETIFQQVQTLREISREFSSFASPFPLEPEPTDLGRLVRETLEPYRQAPPPGVAFEVDIAETLPEVSIDRRLIQRTLINLVENSLNALNGGGRVSVSVRPDAVSEKTGVELTISDTGMGIDPAVRARIFDPYFSTRASGTGLGLAIVRKAVEEHGGTISVESERGKGTMVRVRLPLQSTRAPSEEEALDT